MKKIKNGLIVIGKYLLVFVFSFIYMFLLLFSSSISVHAESINNVAVMEDLYEDKTFNKDDYPSVDNDYALYVMQIGESDKKELFIYAYQPSHYAIDLIGSSVSISYGFSKDGKDLHPQSYDLELISTNGVFDKYYVKDFEILNDGNRFYNIVSISRKFNSVIDTSIENGTTNEIAYSVGQQWCCYDINNSVKYEMVTFETLEVELILNENWYFNSGFKLGNLVGLFDSCDSWSIFFNVDEYVIKHIYDADLTFDKRSVVENWTMFVGTDYTYGEWERKTITLTDTDTCLINNGGLFAKTYNWNRIQTSSDFVNSLKEQKISIESDTLNKINESQWAFSYTETPREHISYDGGYTNTYSEISNVGILRLHFLDNTGKQYDLGVVSDKTTADNIYGGTASGVKDIKEILNDFGDFFEKIMSVVLFILLFVILCFAASVITPIAKLFKLIFKGILYVITFPFRIIKWTFNKK